MPCAPVGGWMWAASPATKARPTEYRSTMRWLIRNTEDHRRLRAVAGSGASRSMTTWMSSRVGVAPEPKPCSIPSPPPAAVDRCGGTSIDMR